MDSIGNVEPEGAQRNRTLSPGDFRQLMECFAVQYKSFRRLLEAYDTAMRNMARNLQHRGLDPLQLPTLAEWEPRRAFTEKQLSMKNMRPEVKVQTSRNPTLKISVFLLQRRNPTPSLNTH